MPKYGVNLVGDAYYEVDAASHDDAVAYAFEILLSESPGSLYWDCNEVKELETSRPR